MLSYVFGITQVIAHHSQLQEIVIVGSEQMHHMALNCPEDTPQGQKEARFESMLCSVPEGKPGYDVFINRSGKIRIDHDGQSVVIKRVSMREYLKTYDWSGELTEEEARPWLEEMRENKERS